MVHAPVKIFLTTSLSIPHLWIPFFLNVKGFVSLIPLKRQLRGSCGAEGSALFPRCAPCFAGTCCILLTSLPVPTHKLLCQGLFTDVSACAFFKAGSAPLLAWGKSCENNLTNGYRDISDDHGVPTIFPHPVQPAVPISCAAALWCSLLQCPSS